MLFYAFYFMDNQTKGKMTNLKETKKPILIILSELIKVVIFVVYPKEKNVF